MYLTGLTGGRIKRFAISAIDLSTNESVLSNTVSGLITGVSQHSSKNPSHYALEQNYPNPFNPSTSIQFDLPQTGFTTLKVYNLLGQEVATLVNETKPAGSYTVQWNALNMTTGMYFYKLTSGALTQVKKMVLVK
jgi:hypothetical protein